nr:restriction endonuclease subunit S [Streptomyces sp. b84]
MVRNVVEKSDGDSHPFVGLEEIESATGRLLVENLPLKAASDSLRHHPGDVLFSKLRPYLAKTYLPTSPGTGTGELLVLRPGPEIDSGFLSYVTRSSPWLDWANSTAYGTKMPRTSWELIGNYRTWLPPLEEQRGIAHFLDAETTRIDRIMRLRAQQEETLRERFGVALREQFDAFETVHTRLKFLLTSRPRYGVLVPEFVDDGIKFIRVNDLLDLEGRARDLVRISAAVSARNPTTVVREGDVLVSVVGTLGRAAIASASVQGANVNRAIAVLRPHSEVNRRLLTAWINAQEFAEQALLATGSDSAQRTLGMEDLSNFTLRWPSTATAQTRLAREVRKTQLGMLNLRKALLAQVAVIKERRQALITAAVTGQFDVSTASGRNVTDGV